MGLLGALVGGSLGFMLGGPLGAMIGGALGFRVGDPTPGQMGMGRGANIIGRCPSCHNRVVFQPNEPLICPHCNQMVFGKAPDPLSRRVEEVLATGQCAACGAQITSD